MEESEVLRKNKDMVTRVIDDETILMPIYKTSEKIKEFNKDIGVIMITGFPNVKVAEETMDKGAYDYIVKPFDLAYLKLSMLTKIVLSPQNQET